MADHIIYTDDNYIRSKIVPRKTDAHKGNFGKVLIFAGSPGMAGAAVLCGRAALKSGAGLVQYLLPDFASPLLLILQTAIPEAMCMEMSRSLSFSSYTAIAAGCGLGKGSVSQSILTRILESYAGTLILDADALNMIAENQDLADRVRHSKAQIILTPHIGETRRLLHTNAPIRDQDSREKAVCELAESYHCIAVLKGAGTLVAWENADADSQFTVCQNTTGNPGMAAGGSGDALAGLIVSLAAQGYPAPDAARMGVFLHGLAGDLAAEELGEMGLISSDIVNYIPYAIRRFYPAR